MVVMVVVAAVIVVVVVAVVALPLLRRWVATSAARHREARIVIDSLGATIDTVAAGLQTYGRSITRCVAARRAHVAAGAVAVLCDTPIAALRSHTGVSGVRTSTVASAGFVNVAQIAAVSPLRLEDIHGIGPVTAAALHEAASQMLSAAARDVDAAVANRSGGAKHDHYVTMLWLHSHLHQLAGDSIADLDAVAQQLADHRRVTRLWRFRVVWLVATPSRNQRRLERLAGVERDIASPRVTSLVEVAHAVISASHELPDIDEVWQWVGAHPAEVRLAVATTDRVGSASTDQLHRWERLGASDLKTTLVRCVSVQLSTVPVARRGVQMPPPPSAGVTDATDLYRLYDQAGRLLYIGISNNVHNRIRTHRVDKYWGPLIARISIEHHATRAGALAAEAHAISRERPHHNVMHNT